jgi:hypothetical protein
MYSGGFGTGSLIPSWSWSRILILSSAEFIVVGEELFSVVMKGCRKGVDEFQAQKVLSRGAESAAPSMVTLVDLSTNYIRS